MTAWQPGDWAVVHVPGRVGKAIAVAEHLALGARRDYEHAITGMPDGQILEAEPGGARIVDMHYDDNLVCWSTGRLPPRLVPDNHQRDLIVARGWQLKDVPYSGLDYLAIAAHRLHIPFPHLQHYIEDTGHMICSQMVDECQRYGGIHLFDDERWSGMVTPDPDLANLINAPVWRG